MKFGETLYQRSIPQWAPYNVDYNSLKRLIKQRTTETAPNPVSIPGQGPAHAVWQPLDDELFPIFKHEHDRAALFIRSKLGEIDRRLAHIERQAQLAEQKPTAPTNRPIQQTRKYQRLVEEADSVGNDIEALSRFASAQRLAFRKILKKYRKWTGSPGLHIRMNNEVLGHVPKEDDRVLGKSRNALNPDMSQYLIRLNGATTTLHSLADRQPSVQTLRPSSKPRATANTASSLTQFAFEQSFMNVTGSRTKSTYWIHHENLDEVKVLLMRRMKVWNVNGGRKSSAPSNDISNVVLFDDDSGLGKSKKVGVAKMLARWSEIDFAYIRERIDEDQKLEEVRRKDLLKFLEERKTPRLRQVALIKSDRECFSKDDTAARLATLETNILIGHFNHTSLGDAITSSKYPIHMQRFPYSVLTISSAESPIIPKLVTNLDHSHLVQLVPGFTLESQAMYSQLAHLGDPPWKTMLESDIRKVPAAVPKRQQRGCQQSIPVSSGPSSTENASIYSAPSKYSSQTSVGNSKESFAPSQPAKSEQNSRIPGQPRRKKKSYGTVEAAAAQRYWNEFDDEPEFNGEEAYTIYVTPDEPFTIPGAATVSRAFGAMYQSLGNSKRRVLSWLPLSKTQNPSTGERTGLLDHSTSPILTDREADLESSSDDDLLSVKDISSRRLASRSSQRAASRGGYRNYSALGYPRRTSRDQLLSFTALGLHAAAWMFLVLATILKSTGRRKAAFEVDAGVISGIVISVACAMFALACALARREPVAMTEWTVVSLLIVCEVVWGVCLGVWVAESAAAF